MNVLNHNILDKITAAILQNGILSIGGESATGKTTLAMQIIGNLLLQHDDTSCIWIQASEIFPKKRFHSLFHSLSKELLSRVFLIPKRGRCNSNLELIKILKSISRRGSILPPNLKFIVVDNISHYLRYYSNISRDIKKKCAAIDDFFTEFLFPLIMFCGREGIKLVLIHEVSFNPKTGDLERFLNRVYRKIDSFDIFLRKFMNKRVLSMEVSHYETLREFYYTITDSGLRFR